MAPTIRFQDMSTGNRAAVLRLIWQRGPLSRAELTRATGFTAPSISRIAEDLIALDLICEEERAPENGVGRPPIGLRFRSEGWAVVGVSLFPDRVQAALIDMAGRTLAEERATVDRPAVEEAFGIIGAIVERLRLYAPVGTRVAGVALLVPGMVEGATASIRYSPPLRWRDVPVREMIARYTDLPVVVENWVSARALAERYFGGAQEVSDYVYVHVSTGIGAAVLSDGKLRRGQAFTSAEFGHLPLTHDGPLCRCGQRGCLEAYATLPALPGYAGAEGATPADILEAAIRGEEAACGAVERAVGYLALGITGLVHLLNPSRIFLDGWPVRAGEVAMAPLREAVAARVLPGVGENLHLVPTRLDPAQSLIGATAMALDELLNLRTEFAVRE